MRSLAYALGIRRRDALLGSVAESSADAIMVVGPTRPDRDGQRRRGVDVRVQPRSDGRRAGLALRAAAGCRDRPRDAAGQGHRAGGDAVRRHGIPGRNHRQPRGRAGRSAAHGDRARHHRAQTSGTTAAVRSDARFAHRPAESRCADEPSRARAHAHACRRSCRIADARPVPLQGSERHARPRSRRPGAARSRAPLRVGGGSRRLRCATGRRRIHARARTDRAERRHRRDRQHPAREPARADPGRRHRDRRRREHRHRALPGRRDGSRDPAAPRGRGDVRREATADAL